MLYIKTWANFKCVIRILNLYIKNIHCGNQDHQNFITVIRLDLIRNVVFDLYILTLQKQTHNAID